MQPFNLTLRPDPNILGTSDADANAEVVPDTSRTEQSSASSASLNGTDKSRRDVADDAAEERPSEQAGTSGAEDPSEGQTQGSIVHQTSGIRYLLDGMLEKVSDAFSRHQPRGTPRPSHTSDTSGDPDEYDEHDRSDRDLPGANNHSEGTRHVAQPQTAELHMPCLQPFSHPCNTTHTSCGVCIVVSRLLHSSFLLYLPMLSILEACQKAYAFPAAMPVCYTSAAAIHQGRQASRGAPWVMGTVRTSAFL